jgi:PKD repeat protein
VSATYTVTLTATNGNCSDDTTFTVEITVGLDEINAVSGLNIYPNPTSADATLEVELANSGEIEVIVMNANGQIMQTVAAEYAEVGTHQFTLNTAEFAQGMYYAVVRTAGTSKTVKLSVIK